MIYEKKHYGTFLAVCRIGLTLFLPSLPRKEVKHMLGLADPWIITAYGLSALSTVLCVVYGAIKWNRD